MILRSGKFADLRVGNQIGTDFLKLKPAVSVNRQG